MTRVTGPVRGHNILVPYVLESRAAIASGYGSQGYPASVHLTVTDAVVMDESGVPRLIQVLVQFPTTEAREFAEQIVTLADEVDPPEDEPADYVRRSEILAELLMERSAQIADGYDLEHDLEHGTEHLVDIVVTALDSTATWADSAHAQHHRRQLVKAAAVLVAAIELDDEQLARNRDKLHAELDGGTA